MQKVELKKVLELLIAEGEDVAAAHLHEWFVGKSKVILEELMQEDDDVLDEIESSKEEIEAEEFFSDVDLEEAFDDEGEEDEFAIGDIEDEADEEIENAEMIEQLRQGLEELRAEVNAITGASEEEIDTLDDLGDDYEMLALGESDLDESFEYEKVDIDMTEPAEIGDGEEIDGNEKSTFPENDFDDRIGGEPVEIDSEAHDGYELEEAPEVKELPILKNQVKSAADDLELIKKEGDTTALLNKEKEAATQNKSPLGGGAVDHVGDEFDR